LTNLDACVVPAEITWEVLVVDNNSTDDTRAVCEYFIEKNRERFRYLFEGKQGKTNALNAGIREARGEILALTDDDVIVDPHWVAEIYTAFQEYDCSAVGGRIIPRWTCKKPAWIEFNGPFRHPAYGGIVNFDKGDQAFELTATAVGANMGLRKSIFKKYGPYRPDLNRVTDLLGGEDTEYCFRLRHAGERIMYAPRAVVYHPVEKYRTSRKYLRSFAFHYGRWLVRIDGVPENAKCYFGVPRYLFPTAAGFFAKWIVSATAKRRSFYKLQVWQTLGQMVEAKRWLIARQSGNAVSGLGLAK
jgi:GT2 family glycosyltransferase